MHCRSAPRHISEASRAGLSSRPGYSQRTETITIPLVVLRFAHLLRDWYGLPAPLAKAEARRRVERLIRERGEGEVVEIDLLRAALASLRPTVAASASHGGASPTEGSR